MDAECDEPRLTMVDLVDRIHMVTDRLRWEKRIQIRSQMAALTDPNTEIWEQVTSHLRNEVAQWPDDDLLTQLMVQWDQLPPAPVQTAVPQELRERPEDVEDYFRVRIPSLEEPEDGYLMVQDIVAKTDVLGDDRVANLAIVVREWCAKLGGNPEHRVFRNLGIARPARRNEAIGRAPRDKEGRLPRLTHQPFQTLGGLAVSADSGEGISEVGQLVTEIRQAQDHFGAWGKDRQREQLCVWGGRLRKQKDNNLITAVDQKAVFNRLMELSKAFRPGHVEAFSIKFAPERGWDDYIAFHERRLEQLVDEHLRTMERLAEGDDLAGALGHLERLLRLPRERRQGNWEQQVLAQVEQVLVFTDDLEKLRPLGEPLQKALRTLKEGRPLLRRLRDILPEPEIFTAIIPTDDKEEEDTDDELIHRDPKWELQRQKVVNHTRDKTAILLGGDPRPEARDRLCDELQLADLDWIEVKSAGGTQLDSLKQKIRRRNIQLVICLARFSQHAFDYKLKDACKEAHVPYVIVEHGYGISRIVTTLAEFFDGWDGEE
ncbi:MAG: hypothetical protein HUU55_18110 [Myxococcales bacterium]|nr:hypothetical protein [Myxococcales bacterium]